MARHLHRDELFATLAVSAIPLPSDRFGIDSRRWRQAQGSRAVNKEREVGPVQVQELPAAGTACRWTEKHGIGSSRLRGGCVSGSRSPSVMEREGMQSVCNAVIWRGPFFMAARGGLQELQRDLLDQVGSAGSRARPLPGLRRSARPARSSENASICRKRFDAHPFESRGLKPNLLAALRKVDLVAATNTSVLILGETGTGKADRPRDPQPRRRQPRWW